MPLSPEELTDRIHRATPFVATLGALMPERLQFLLAGHLSAQNNRRELVAEALDRTLRSERTTMHIAQQDGFSGWFSLG